MDTSSSPPEDDWWHSDGYRDWLQAWWKEDFSLEGLKQRLKEGEWQSVSELISGFPTFEFSGRNFSIFHLPLHDPAGMISNRTDALAEHQTSMAARLVRALENDRGSSATLLRGMIIDYPIYFENQVIRSALDADYAFFADPAQFSNLDFRKWATFNKAYFEDCSFINSHFQSVASFRGCSFRYADFSGTRFSAGANFEDCRFIGSATFSNCDFASGASFDGSSFLAEFYFDQSRTLDVTSSEDKKEAFLFRRCSFLMDSHFSNRDFGRPTDFSESRFYGFARFHNCRLHQDTTFRDTDFGPHDRSPIDAIWGIVKYDTKKSGFNYDTPSRATALPPRFEPLDALNIGGKFYQYDMKGLSEYRWTMLALHYPWRMVKTYKSAHFADLEQSFRILRRVCSEASLRPEANKFFRLEMHARRRRPLGRDIGWTDKILSHLYGSLARYGESVLAPLLWLALLLIFAGFALHLVWGGDPTHNYIYDVSGAMKAVFRPFAVWNDTVSPINPRIDSTPHQYRVLTSNFLMTFVSIASVSLIFLFGLAVKRRFQMD